MINTVSFFAGCGGLDFGLKGGFTYGGEFYNRLPFNILKAYEIDKKCVETYLENVGDHIEQADLSAMNPKTMPFAPLLVGGFPCQEFSSCGPRGGLSTPRGQLYKVFIEYMNVHNPALVVAENVPNLKRMDKGQVLKTILDELESAGTGYRFVTWSLAAPQYGVPQLRERLFLIGVRKDLESQPSIPLMPFPSSTDYRSIEWAIDDLLHVTDNSVPNQDQYFHANRAKRGNGQGDESSKRTKPAYTVRANPKSRVQFHYELERRLTIREIARIQTFPDTFKFLHAKTHTTWQIGNAVPPVMAHHVGQAVAAYVNALEKAQLLPLVTPETVNAYQ